MGGAGCQVGHLEHGVPDVGLLIIVAFVFLYAVVMTLSVMTENAPIGLLGSCAVLMFSPVLAAHEQITPVLSRELYRDIFRSMYWVFPKIAELIGAVRSLIVGTPLGIGTGLWTSALFTPIVSQPQ